jgi:hypothetical protein
MIKKRYVIKFFPDEGFMGIEIHQSLKDHYGDSAMSRSEVYRWIRDIKVKGENGPQNDLKSRKEARQKTFRGNPTQDQGRSSFIGLQDCSLSWNRKINRLSSLSICVRDKMLPSPMNSIHINSGPKLTREEVAKIMLDIFANHAASNFHFHCDFIFTGDES